MRLYITLTIEAEEDPTVTTPMDAVVKAKSLYDVVKATLKPHIEFHDYTVNAPSVLGVVEFDQTQQPDEEKASANAPSSATRH